MARIAKSLDVLRDQIDEAFPNRSKLSDGWLGDAAHAARKSDHNPNSADVVQAIDVTNDPENGLDAAKLADKLLASHDKRIKYIISNSRIGASYATSGAMPWAWRPYTGSNAHQRHFHCSVQDEPTLYDSTERWDFLGDVVPEPIQPAPVASVIHQQMARKIINYEYDKRPFKIYQVTDGSNEIAGVNQKKHPDFYDEIAAVVGNDAAVEREVSEFYLTYSNAAMQWTSDLGVEFFLRDCIVNRGPTGAAIILQKAVGVEEDGAVGTNTKAAVAKVSPENLLQKLRVARETYEIEKYGKRENLWKGLNNRWNKAMADAKTFQDVFIPEPVPVPTPTPVPVPTPLPIPPPSPIPIDFDLLKRLYSVNWKAQIDALNSSIDVLTAARNHLLDKLQTPADVIKAVQSGKTAAQIVEERPKGKLMNSDTMWMLVRYALIGGGSFLAGKGYVTMEQVNTFVEKLPTIIAGITPVLTIIWGLYVKAGTKPVPVATAARADVPTTNSATGAVER